MNEYNKKHHKTMKIKPIDVIASTHIDSGVKNNDKNPKFKVVDCVSISRYKSIFSKDYTPNLWFFVIKWLKPRYEGHM